MSDTAVVASLGVVFDAACFWIGLRFPRLAVAVLLLLLPFHTLTIVLLRHWLGDDVLAVNVVGLWKEALVAGLVIPALAQMRRGWWDRTSVFAVSLAAFATLLVPLSAVAHPLSAVLVDWRGIALAPLAFVAVRLRGPALGSARRLIGAYVAVAVVAAIYSFVQVFVLGFRFLFTYYRDPGEGLATAYKIGLKGFDVPRAIGTFVAPNEFGLFLSVAAFGFLAVYLACMRRAPALAISPGAEAPSARVGQRVDPRLVLPAGAAVVILAALLLTYSRSAWVASAVAFVVLAVGMGALRAVRRWVVGRPRIGLPVVGLGIVALVGVAVVSGALELAIATVTGSELSAAARGSSFAKGMEAFLAQPLGSGLASAGPRAYAVDSHAVRTEMWYLAVLVEIGAVGGLLLLGTIAGITAQLLLAWATPARTAAVPATAAWLGALTGALFIPVLFDVPTALPVWILAGLAVRTALPLEVRSTAPVLPVGPVNFRDGYGRLIQTVDVPGGSRRGEDGRTDEPRSGGYRPGGR